MAVTLRADLSEQTNEQGNLTPVLDVFFMPVVAKVFQCLQTYSHVDSAKVRC